MERIKKLEQDKKLMEAKILGLEGARQKPSQMSSDELDALKQSYLVKERKWKDDAEKADMKVFTSTIILIFKHLLKFVKMRSATSKYRDNLESCKRVIRF
jgi:hypothetical protein